MVLAVIALFTLGIILLVLAFLDILADATVLFDIVIHHYSIYKMEYFSHEIDRFKNPKLFWFCFLLEFIGALICFGFAIRIYLFL